MSAHVLLNLLNSLECRDSIYHMTLKLLIKHTFGLKTQDFTIF